MSNARRNLLWIGVALVPILLALLSLSSFMTRMFEPPAPRVPLRPYENAQPLADALAAELDEPIRIERIDMHASGAEVHVALEGREIAQRYSMAGSGNLLRRGGSRVPVEAPFELSEVDFSLLPALIAETGETLGAPGIQPTRIALDRDDDGVLRWKIHASPGQSGWMTVLFDAGGSFHSVTTH